MSTFVLKAAIAHDYLINTFWGGSGVNKKNHNDTSINLTH